MYLKELIIKNFRGIENLELEFQKGLNVIIGENNTGKTAVIDALRLVYSIGTPRREIYVNEEDFYVNKYGEINSPIEFDLFFSDLNKQEQGLFYELLSLDESLKGNGDEEELKIELHIRYFLETRKGIKKIIFRYWGGEKEGGQIPPEVMELFYFVSLHALRNAERDLIPRRGSQLGQLFINLVDDEEEKKRLQKIINDNIKSEKDWNELIKEAKGKISTHLEGTSHKYNIPEINIEFLSLEFQKIVDTLKINTQNRNYMKRTEIDKKFKENNRVIGKYFEKTETNDLIFKDKFIDTIKKDKDISPQDKELLKDLYKNSYKTFEIYQNGLGLNNLIYMATVLGDLIERRKADIEAYIALLIEEPEAHIHPQLQNVLFEYFKKMEKKNIQVFITSHSPTITAKTNLDNTIVLYSKENNINYVPIKNIPLNSKHKKYLERFLDVTKSQLFFARGVILVEGISEALLLPVFTSIMDLNTDKYNLDKSGVEVINIGGVAFEPFAKLFNNQDVSKNLNIQCALITDDDRDEDGNICSRAEKAKSLKSDNLLVVLAKKTFEYELFLKNEDILIDVYKTDLNHSQTKIIGKNIHKRAICFIEKLKQNKEKGEFSQALSVKLKENNILRHSFKVPEYIQEAIRWVTKVD
jgi:putative ATP-dependent endonuclease of OLD family